MLELIPSVSSVAISICIIAVTCFSKRDVCITFFGIEIKISG
jgi:hypothetical protein